jgi:membrane-associated phospholipid phosphatase
MYSNSNRIGTNGVARDRASEIAPSHLENATADTSANRARILTWGVAVLATLCAALMTWQVGFDLDVNKTLLFCAGLILLLAAAHCFYTIVRPAPILASATGAVALIAWSLMMVGIISLASLGTHAPLVDSALVKLDAAIGVNVASIVTWLSHYPGLVTLLGFAYESSTALLFLSIVALAVTNQGERLWIYCFSLTGAALVCAMSSSLIPAIGAFTTFGISGDTLARLPHGAGVYFIDAFKAYRNGNVSTIDMAHMTAGVVNFPSFHTVMALAAIYAFRAIRFCAWPAYIWNGLVIVSTIPMGGHYVTDLIAGAFVWSALAVIGGAAQPFSRALGGVYTHGGAKAWLAPDPRPHAVVGLVAGQIR